MVSRRCVSQSVGQRACQSVGRRVIQSSTLWAVTANQVILEVVFSTQNNGNTKLTAFLYLIEGKNHSVPCKSFDKDIK